MSMVSPPQAFYKEQPPEPAGERIGPNGEPTARHQNLKEFQEKRMEKLAEGKDPYEEFAKTAKARSEDAPLPRLLRRMGLGKLFKIGEPEKKDEVVK